MEKRDESDEFQEGLRWLEKAPPGAALCREKGRHFQDPRVVSDITPDPKSGGWIESFTCLSCSTIVHNVVNPDYSISSAGRKYEYPEGYLAEPGNGWALLSKDARRAFRMNRFANAQRRQRKPK